MAPASRLSMRKTTRNTLLLAFGVVALGVALRFELQREASLGPMPLTNLNPADLKTLRVGCTDCRARHFEHRATGWWMIEPYPLRADDSIVSRLALVARAPVRTTLDPANYDLAKLGLDHPRSTLALDDVTIEFGDEDPIEHDRYVRIGGKLMRVADRFGARLLEPAEVELDRHLIDTDAVIVEVAIGAAAPRADLAAAWKRAVALQMQPSPSAPADATPIRVELADATQWNFSMRGVGDHYAVRRDDIGLDYIVGEADAQALLGKSN